MEQQRGASAGGNWQAAQTEGGTRTREAAARDDERDRNGRRSVKVAVARSRGRVERVRVRDDRCIYIFERLAD